MDNIEAQVVEPEEMTDNSDEVSEGLPDWKNRPQLSHLVQDVKDAKNDYDKHVNDVNRWLENLNVKEAKVTGTQSKVAPKLIRKQAEWRYASLSEPFLSTPDLFNVYPITAGDVKRAKQNELVLNNQFNTKISKVAFIDQYVRDAVDLGSVIVKVSWDSEEEEIEKEIPTFEYYALNDPQMQQQYLQMAQLKQTDPDAYADMATPELDESIRVFLETQQFVLARQTGTEIVTVVEETKNQPALEVCYHENIILDPSCNGDLSKAEFICEKFKTSLSALKKDGKYINLDAINIEGASPLASEDYVEGKDNDNFNFTDKERKQFVVHTYWGNWDINGTGETKPIVVSWVGDTIIRMEENPYPDGALPFVIVPYMPVRRSVYGEPDGELLDPNQKIIGAVTRGMLDLLGKSANSQMGIRRDMLDTTNMRKFQRGEDYVFNATVDPRQGFYTHTYPEIPQSAYNMLTLQQDDAESLTGVKAFHSGISGQALGNTATGIRSALDASSKRELAILRRLAQGVIEIGQKIIAMNAVFLSEEETIRITNNQFIHVRRDDLAGKFDLRLSISTAEEDNRKAEELAYMLQTMGNSMDFTFSQMILADIARLRKMPALAEKIEQYQPQPDPVEQMKAQLEIELLKAQIAKENALAQKNMAEAELSGARTGKETSQAALNLVKTGTEKAKARHLASDADKKDLDFVEQESGVQQARELEQLHLKHAHAIEQAQHNAELSMADKVVDHTIAQDKEKQQKSSNP